MRSATIERPEVKPFPEREADRWDQIEAWVRAGASFDDAIRLSEDGGPGSGFRALRRLKQLAADEDGSINTGQLVLQNVPTVPYEINPATFFAATEENWFSVGTVPFSAGNPWAPLILPNVGVIGKILIEFVGTLTVTLGGGTATSTARWPYGLLDSVAFTANGSDDLFSCSGLSLKALERTRYPYLTGFDEDLIGPGSGGGLTVPGGATPLRLSYEIPLAMDESSLVGAIFAQARAVSMALKARDGAIADIVTLGGAATATLTGTWHVAIQTYQIPVAQDGKLILPDLRYLHGFNEIITPHSNLGDVRSTLIRVAGTMNRIFVQNLQKSSNAPAFYSPASSTDIAEYRLEFGGNKRPYVFAPAQFLLSQNVKDYGARLPYSFVVLDAARYNPVRDAINLAGITELYWITKIGSGATAPDASAQQRVVQETLFT